MASQDDVSLSKAGITQAEPDLAELASFDKVNPRTVKTELD